MEIRIFEPESAPLDLYRFRYAIYVEEMRRKQFYASHKDRTITDPLDATAVNIVAIDGDAICGCVRVNFLRRGPIGEYQSLYGIDRLPESEQQASSITTRLMVGRAWRRTTVTSRLITTIYEYALRRDILTDYIDCNRHLIPFFERLGYRKRFTCNHPEYGDVTVMSIDVRDRAHLRKIASPFLPILSRWMDESDENARTAAFEPA